MAIFYPKSYLSLKVVLHDYGLPSFRQPDPLLIQPINLSVRINSYSEADTLQAQLRFEDFPFDPRLVQNILVTASIVNLKKLRPQSNFDLNRIKENAIFIGFCDMASIELDASGRTITLEALDYTEFFLNTKWDDANLPDPKTEKRTRKISLNRPFVSILKDLKSNVPGAESIQIEDRTNGVVSNALVSAGGNFSLSDGRMSSDGQNHYVQKFQNYWDVVSALANEVGLIVYIELDKIVITTPEILYSGEGFSSKKVLPFLYGENISRLSFKRNLGRKKRFNIVMRSWDTKTNVPVEVSIPRDARASWIRETKIQKGVQMIQTLGADGQPVSKPAPAYLFPFQRKTKEQLITLGQEIFAEIVRQQVEGEFQTHEMEIRDQQGTSFDLTQLKTGMAILLEMTQKDLKFILRKDEQGNEISNAKRVMYLIRRGYSRKTAEILIEAVAKTTGRIRPVFYLKGVELNIDSNGFSLRAEIENYIQLGTFARGEIVSG